MIKAIVFDYDGTLSNRQRNAYDTFKPYLRQFFNDISDIEYEAILQDMMLYDCNGSTAIKNRVPAFISKYKLPDDFTEKFTEYYSYHMPDYTVLKPETEEVLIKLKNDGYKLGLITNGETRQQHTKIDNVDIEKYFDYLIVSGDLENNIKKPKKEIFDIMAKNLNLKNEECMYVGDVFSSDILGAINGGFLPVWYPNSTELPADYYKGYRISNLKDIFDILKVENER